MSPELESTLARIADPRLGIIHRIADVPLQPGEPRIFVLAARCTRPKYFNRNRSEPVSAIDYTLRANGVAFTREEAVWRVIGEACERYAGGLYSEPTLITATREELGQEALPVEQLIAFSDAQYARPGFPFVRFDPRAPLRWACGWNLTRGVRSFVPAVLVYLGYVARYPHEAFYPTLSTGMAAGRSLEHALLNGLCEVVERDAFMCAWLLRHVQARVPSDSLWKVLSESERQLLASECADPFVLTATTDIGLPSVLTALRLRNRDALVVGAATSTCVRHAIVRSALEAFHTLNWSIVLDRAPVCLARDQVRDFEDHVRYYLDGAHFQHIVWLTQAREACVDLIPDPPADHATQLRRALDHVQAAGYEVHYVETTTPDIRSLGIRTVRVLIPGLHPLNVGHPLVHEDWRRVRRVAAFWGLEADRAINPEPHPFP